MSEKPNSENCGIPQSVLFWFFFLELLQLSVLIGLIMFGSRHG
jgi:hypothetical protein